MPRHRDRKAAPVSHQLSIPTAALLIALAAVPGFFNIQSTMSFEPDKAVMTRTLVSLAAVFLLAGTWQTWRSRQLSFGRPAVWQVLLAGVVLVAAFATVLSVDPVTSFWGGYERAYGFLAVVAASVIVVIAYRAARLGQPWALVDAALLGALAPALYGLLQVFGHDPVRGQTVSFVLGQRASSTLGNPLFLADYLLLAIVLGCARLLAGPPLASRRRLALGFYLVMLAGAFVATGSRSGFFGAATALAFFLVAGGHQKRRRAWSLAGVAVLAAGGMILLLAWVSPQLLPTALGNLFASGGTGGQRLLIWKSIMALLSQDARAAWMGVGLDALSLRLGSTLPAELAHFEVDWAFRIPDRAHSYPLDVSAQMGLLGLVAVSGFWALVLARLMPTLAVRRPHAVAVGVQLVGAMAAAALAWLLAGPAAATLGWTAGLMAGALLIHLLAMVQPAVPQEASPPLAPFLLAGLAGHWVLVGFSFNTQAADLLLWTAVGVALGISGGQQELPVAVAPIQGARLAGIAAAVFGFSLSAALPSSLPLWLAAVVALYLLALVLQGPVRSAATETIAFLGPIAALLPAMWLNRTAGVAAWLALFWLMVWLGVQTLFLLPGRQPLKTWLAAAAALVLALAMAVPLFGDVAFKSAILHPESVTARDAYVRRALLLSPYDHVVAAGVVPTEALSLPAGATLDHAQARRIAQLYELAIASQPLAPEPASAYAEWLRQRSAHDPSAAPLARAQFERLLQLAPNDIESRNRFALLDAAAGRPGAAEAELHRLISLDPLYGPAYLNLARLQNERGDITAARQTLTTGAANVPWWAELQTALDDLP